MRRQFIKIVRGNKKYMTRKEAVKFYKYHKKIQKGGVYTTWKGQFGTVSIRNDKIIFDNSYN